MTLRRPPSAKLTLMVPLRGAQSIGQPISTPLTTWTTRQETSKMLTGRGLNQSRVHEMRCPKRRSAMTFRANEAIVHGRDAPADGVYHAGSFFGTPENTYDLMTQIEAK